MANASMPELEATAVLGSSFEAHAAEILARHLLNENPGVSADDYGAVNADGLMSVLNVLVNRFHDVDGLIAQLNEVNQSITNGDMRSTRRFELEALQAGQVCTIQIKYSVLEPHGLGVEGRQDSMTTNTLPLELHRCLDIL